MNRLALLNTAMHCSIVYSLYTILNSLESKNYTLYPIVTLARLPSHTSLLTHYLGSSFRSSCFSTFPVLFLASASTNITLFGVEKSGRCCLLHFNRASSETYPRHRVFWPRMRSVPRPRGGEHCLMINQHVLYLYAGDILAAAETKKRRGEELKKKKNAQGL